MCIMQIVFSCMWSTEMFELSKSFCQLYLQDLSEKNIKNHKMKFCKKKERTIRMNTLNHIDYRELK